MIEKSELPWENEPDSKVLQQNGLKCLIWRHPDYKFLCGYVRIPKSKLLRRSKPTFKHGRLIARNFWHYNAHEGITFFGHPWHLKGRQGLWIGFDCGHGGDLVPRRYIENDRWPGIPEYRTFEYVEEQTRHLADQIFIKLLQEKLRRRY